MFGRNPTEICLIFTAWKSWEQPSLSPENLADYTYSIHVHGSPLQTVLGLLTEQFEELPDQTKIKEPCIMVSSESVP